jgi:hypothetical protein
LGRWRKSWEKVQWVSGYVDEPSAHLAGTVTYLLLGRYAGSGTDQPSLSAIPWPQWFGSGHDAGVWTDPPSLSNTNDQKTRRSCLLF